MTTSDPLRRLCNVVEQVAAQLEATAQHAEDIGLREIKNRISAAVDVLRSACGIDIALAERISGSGTGITIGVFA